MDNKKKINEFSIIHNGEIYIIEVFKHWNWQSCIVIAGKRSLGYNHDPNKDFETEARAAIDLMNDPKNRYYNDNGASVHLDWFINYLDTFKELDKIKLYKDALLLKEMIDKFSEFDFSDFPDDYKKRCDAVKDNIMQTFYKTYGETEVNLIPLLENLKNLRFIIKELKDR